MILLYLYLCFVVKLTDGHLSTHSNTLLAISASNLSIASNLTSDASDDVEASDIRGTGLAEVPQWTPLRLHIAVLTFPPDPARRTAVRNTWKQVADRHPLVSKVAFVACAHGVETAALHALQKENA